MKIAISGRSGCGNSTTSKSLADKLNLELVHYTFHDYAQDHNLDFFEVRKMARQDPAIDRYIDQRQMELAKKGNCIIASRLAIWLVEDADFFVYLRAPLRVRSQRISQREQRNYWLTLYVTAMRDLDDSRRYKKMYGINSAHHSFVDLTVDTVLYSTTQIVDLIVQKVNNKV